MFLQILPVISVHYMAIVNVHVAGTIDIPAVRIGGRRRSVRRDGTDLDIGVLDIVRLIHQARESQQLSSEDAHLCQNGELMRLRSATVIPVALPTHRGMGRAKTLDDPPAIPAFLF